MELSASPVDSLPLLHASVEDWSAFADCSKADVSLRDIPVLVASLKGPAWRFFRSDPVSLKADIVETDGETWPCLRFQLGRRQVVFLLTKSADVATAKWANRDFAFVGLKFQDGVTALVHVPTDRESLTSQAATKAATSRPMQRVLSDSLVERIRTSLFRTSKSDIREVPYIAHTDLVVL